MVISVSSVFSAVNTYISDNYVQLHPHLFQSYFFQYVEKGSINRQIVGSTFLENLLKIRLFLLRIFNDHYRYFYTYVPSKISVKIIILSSTMAHKLGDDSPCRWNGLLGYNFSYFTFVKGHSNN